MLLVKRQNTLLYIKRDILLLRKAKATEAGLLTELTVNSKAYWGYSEEFMAACIDELVVPKEKLENPNFCYMVAEVNGELLGYYGLEPLSKVKIELSALFVKSTNIGSGIGKALLAHAMNVALDMGGTNLVLQSDPNAEGFYIANGWLLTGKQESLSFPGRYLPTFSMSLSEGMNA